MPMSSTSSGSMAAVIAAVEFGGNPPLPFRPASRRSRGSVPHRRHRVVGRTGTEPRPAYRQPSTRSSAACCIVVGVDAPPASHEVELERSRQRTRSTAMTFSRRGGLHPSIAVEPGMRLYGKRIMLRPLMANDFAQWTEVRAAQRAVAHAMGAVACQQPVRPDSAPRRVQLALRDSRPRTAGRHRVRVRTVRRQRLRRRDQHQQRRAWRVPVRRRRILDRSAPRRQSLHRRGSRRDLSSSRSTSCISTAWRSASCRATPTAAG